MRITIRGLGSYAVGLFGLGGLAAAELTPAQEMAIGAIIAECQPSTLSAGQQAEELRWLARAAQPYAGQEINVVSEIMPVHTYEAEVLAPHFATLTGIKLKHHLISESEVVKKIQEQGETGQSNYDLYVNDTDLIGTHYRNDWVIPIGDFMAGEGKDLTSPHLDLGDFIGLAYASAGGKLYQLPDQQFANFYWFRHDWFGREDLKAAFKAKYGYGLGVPLNWSAYQDIAEFFSTTTVDGMKAYGHSDYGKKDPSLGWRFTDSWLAMAGVGDPGLPNGKPVDEWGIRVDGQDRPVGASVVRGGETNGPAAVYGLSKFIEFFQYAPPECKGQDFFQTATRNGLNPATGRADVAQQLFWYNCFVAPLTDPKACPDLLDSQGLPKWRIAPNPKGSYWQEGMKLSYQDVGAWTMLASTPAPRRQAAWLYAQFAVSKTVSLKKFVKGVTPIRKSDLFSAYLTEKAPHYGGLIEAYRSREVNEQHTPTGTNVPDYPRLWNLWYPLLGQAVAGELTPQQALDKLAGAMDDEMAAMEELGMARAAPKLNPAGDAAQWLAEPGAPKAKLDNEKPQGATIAYEVLLERWKADPLK